MECGKGNVVWNQWGIRQLTLLQKGGRIHDCAELLMEPGPHNDQWSQHIIAIVSTVQSRGLSRMSKRERQGVKIQYLRTICKEERFRQAS